MIPKTQRRVVIAGCADGAATEANFRLEEGPVAEPGPGQVLVRTLYLALDPYMGGMLSPGGTIGIRSDVGEPMRGGVVGQVVASNHPGFAVGDYVEDRLSWEEYAIGPGPAMRKVDPALGPLSVYNTALGMPGMTAYFGLFEFARTKPGETVLVSGATGGVGSLAAQMAKIVGCRVVGVAGGREKCDWLIHQAGLDGDIDYKAGSDLNAAVKRACPQGVDVYFDCTGGPTTDVAFANMALHGRVVFVGGASHDSRPAPRLSNYFVGRRLNARGFIIFDHTADWGPAVPIVASWLKGGRIRTRDEIVDGLENAANAFVRMLQGETSGKPQVRVAAE